jgi:RNA polymerase sigma factor (sigma-70 family)
MKKPQSTPLLTAEQEQQLARRIDAGVLAAHLLAGGDRPVAATSEELTVLVEAGRQAWDDFLLANLGLVWNLVRRETGRAGVPIDDLFQEGFVALAGALQRFDPERGRFSTFATVRVRQRLSEAAASRLGALALPASRALQLRQARGVEGVLAQEFGRSIELAELAEALGRPVEWTRQLLGHRPPSSLNPADDGPATTDTVPDPDQAIYARQVRRVLRRIDSEQAEVLALRYGLATGEPVDVAGVAARLGLSTSTVRRLESRGLAALRAVAGQVDPLAGSPLAG